MLIALILSLFTSLSHAEIKSAKLFRLCMKGESCSCPKGDVQVKEDYGTEETDWSESYFYKCIAPKHSFLEIPEKGKVDPITLVRPTNCVECEEEEDQESLAEKAMLKAIEDFPAGCGYEWDNFNTVSFKENINNIVNDKPILCDSKHKNMCTSAVFLAFLKTMKQYKARGDITQDTFDSYTKLDQPAWEYVNGLARPDVMVQKIKVGKGMTLEKKDLPNDEWPAPGDMLQIWRENDSGHSTIFTGYLNDNGGNRIGFCYWSAQSSTDGFGKKCEKFEKIKKIHAGRITL